MLKLLFMLLKIESYNSSNFQIIIYCDEAIIGCVELLLVALEEISLLRRSYRLLRLRVRPLADLR